MTDRAKMLAENLLEMGARAYDQGDFGVAVEHWEHAANLGDALAQYHLGYMYVMGDNVQQDFYEAFFLFSAMEGWGDFKHEGLQFLLSELQIQEKLLGSVLVVSFNGRPKDCLRSLVCSVIRSIEDISYQVSPFVRKLEIMH